MAENRNEAAAGMVFPRSLMIAAKTFADRPKVVGEILVALVAPKGAAAERGLSDMQKYVLAECREEIGERLAKRKAEAERKAAQRRRQ